MGKRLKNSDDRKKKRMKKFLRESYQGSLLQKCYMDGRIGSMRGRERKDGRKIGDDGKIPQDEET